MTPGGERARASAGLRDPRSDLSRLVRAAQTGGQIEIEELIARVRDIAHRYARARLATYPGGQHLADDVTQDVCIAILAALPRYRDRGRPFEAFVYGVSSRKVADAQRAASRSPVPTDELADAIDEEPTPEDRAIRWSEVESACELLDRLPPRLRDVMLLRVASGLSAEETGVALGMTAGAVRVAQHRAVTKMRALAGQQREVGND